MKHFTARLLTLCFSLTAFFAVAQVPNDECSGAYVLSLGQDSVVCDINGSTNFATVSAYPQQCCNTNFTNDVWYTFTATSVNQTISVYNITAPYSNSVAFAVTEIFSGTCASLQYVRQNYLFGSGDIYLTDLTIGQNYFIRIYGNVNYYYYSVDFDICLSETPVPPNDDCVNAATIIPDLSEVPNNVITLDTRGATTSLPDCNGNTSVRDIWYKFTATSPSHAVVPYNTGFDTLRFEVFSGVCGSLSSIKCDQVYSNYSVFIQGLTIGETYYIRFFTKFPSNYLSFSLTTLPLPPANDECVNATPLTIGTTAACDPIVVLTTGATPSLPSCEASVVHDLWYSFTATSEHVLFEMINPAGNYGPIAYAHGYELYSGSCGQLTSISCAESAEYFTANGLTVGDTYLLRIFSAENLSHYLNVCGRAVSPPPSNAGCATASALTINTNQSCSTVTHGTTLNATYTEGCYPPGASVWYSFTPSTGAVILSFLNKQSELYSSDLHFELYKNGCDPDSLLFCEFVFEEPKMLTDLVPGNTYYIKVGSPFYSGVSFDICLQSVEAPPNDHCANATALTVQPGMDCISPVQTGIYGATVTPNGDCQYRAEVWYAFTATQSTHILQMSNQIPTYPWTYSNNYSYALYSGNCSSLQLHSCKDDVAFGNIGFGDLVAGETYYVAIATTYYGTVFSFDICLLTPPQTSANDACVDALAVAVNPGATCDLFESGNTANASFSPASSNDCNISTNDVWYKFTATQYNHTITFNNVAEIQNNGFTYAVAEVYSGDCQSFTRLNSSCYVSSGHIILLENLTPGSTYYVAVRPMFEWQNVSFDLCITSPPPPANDNCDNATALAVNEDFYCTNQTEGSTFAATPSAGLCGPAGSADVWFSFEATGSVYRMDLNNTSYPSDIGYELFNGDCNNLTSLACKFPYSYNPANFSNLIAGQTYFVRVFTYPGVPQTFNVCLRKLPEPPANDYCAQAEVITPNTGLTCDLVYNGTVLSATSQDSSVCSGRNFDVWYTFTASESQYVLQLDNVQSVFGIAVNPNVEILTGTCGSLVHEECFYNFFSPVLFATTPGQTYYIRVANYYNADAFSYSLCLKTAPSPSNNSTCFSASEIVSNQGQTCDLTYPGNTVSLPGQVSYGPCATGNDIWYYFTATESTHILELQNFVTVYGGTSYINIELYQGSNCLNFNFLTCVGYFNQPQVLSGLVPGQTYYLRFVSDIYSGAVFDICLQSVLPPANDQCAGAETLSVNPDLTCNTPTYGTNYGAGQTPGTFCTDGSGDVWYQFTATQAAHVISLQNVLNHANNNYANAMVEVFEGSCGNLTAVACRPYINNADIFVGDLTPGATYFVRILGVYYYEFINFTLCILTPPAPPANDGCSGAFALIPASGNQCETITSGTTLNATPSWSGFYEGFNSNDVWYSFTATSPNHVLQLNNIVNANYFYGDQINGILYAAPCITQPALHSFSTYYSGEVLFTNLTPGQEYIIRLYGSYSTSPLNFDVCLTTPPAPANDLCENATPAVLNSGYSCQVNNSGSTLGASSSGGGCENAVSNDVWYQFVAPTATMNIGFSFENVGYNLTAGFEVYSGDCNGLTSVYCQNSFQNNSLLSGLTTGNTYYIRIFSGKNASINYNLCLIPLPNPPANDECTGAFPVGVNSGLDCTTQVAGTTISATHSLAACIGYSGVNDVWYTFTATETQHIFDLNVTENLLPGGSQDISMEIFSGTCNDLQLINCQPFSSVHSFFANGFAPGQTYFIKVNCYDNSGQNFALCIRSLPPVPVNLGCESAETVTPNSGMTCDVVTSGQTASVPELSSSNCGSNGRALWYSFTATSNYHILSFSNVAVIYGYPNLQFELYQGNCNALSLMTCGYASEDLQLTGLTSGEQYFVRVSDNSYGALSFDLCIKTVPVPANDLCENATELPVGPGESCDGFTSGTTAGATLTGPTTCSINGPDVWYSFTATQGSHIIQLANVGVFPYNYYEYFSLEVYRGSCTTPELISCWSSLVYGTTQIVGDLEAGETYFVRVGGLSQMINFDICISTPPAPPANDACFNAVSIPVAAGTACETVVSGTTLYATVSPPPVNYYNTGNDVWYTFVATSQNHSLLVNNVVAAIGGFGSFVKGAVYEGTCTSLNALHYFEAYYSSTPVELSNLVSGNTYYVRIYSEDSYAYANFDICISTPLPAANDECTTASTLYVNPDSNCDSLNYGTILGASSSQSGCVTGPTIDVWHTFIATSADMRIGFNIAPYSPNYNGVEVFEGTCGALNSIHCGNSGAPTILHGITPGNTYYIRVYAYANSAFNYTLCLFDIPPVPSNDLCENAIEVIPNNDLSCDNHVVGSTGGLEEVTYWQCYYGVDMWYKFTATATSHIVTVNRLSVQYGFADLFFGVFGGDVCNNNYTSLACNPAGSVVVNNLTPGEVYYIRVVGSDNSGVSFDVCVRANIPPVNDNCENAVTLIPASGNICQNYITGSTAGATPSPYYYYGCFNGYNDIWYNFQATDILHNLNVNANGASFPYGLYIELFSGSCESLVLLNCQTLNNSGDIPLTNLIPGETYYLRISSYPYGAGAVAFFDLCITTLPVDLAFGHIATQNGDCNLGNNETVYVGFYNNSSAYIPAGYATANLAVSGNNTGEYGPVTNQYVVYPYSYGTIVVNGVDLSNGGLSTLTGSIGSPNDNNSTNNTGEYSLTIQPSFTIYPDNDNDGYGDDNIPLVVCTMYYGYTTTPGDCNDYNPAVNPAATEICNGYDDDCDGEVDETTLDINLSAPVIPCGGTFTTLTATATGGAEPYQFSLDSIWSGAVNSWQVGAGTHLVIAYDAYGCGISEYITIAPPNNIVVSPINVTHVSCQGGNSGAINISVSGGSGVYTYLWSNNKTTQDIVNLAAGTYTVVVTDNQGCTTSVAVVVNPRLTLTATKTNAICNGTNTGTATAVPVGGTPGYSYAWSNGGTTATINNLSTGNYTVTVSDALGCTRKVTVTISQPPAINIGTAITNAVCYQQPGGAIDITVSNAVAPLSYLWSDGATTEDRIAVVGGTYTVTVTDANGCSKTKVSTVTEPAPITTTFNVKNPKCNGSADGEITATINGGTKYPANNQCNGERYCIQWSNGATSRKITGLTAGVYTVTITDLNGCSLVSSATVTEPAALVITNVATQTMDNGKYKVTITATGGTPSYKYKRTPGPTGYQTSNVFNNVPPGSYVFEVSDNNNCATTTSVNLPVFFQSPSGAEDRIAESNEEVLEISMLPNPATDAVQILLDTDLDNAEVTVFDLQGRQIHRQEFSGTATTIQLDGWSAGMYLVEIRSNGERYVRKLSVVR